MSWITMRDGSLTMGSGLEVVSPILRDNNEDIEDIYMVCNMLQEAEQEIGRRNILWKSIVMESARDKYPSLSLYLLLIIAPDP